MYLLIGISSRFVRLQHTGFCFLQNHTQSFYLHDRMLFGRLRLAKRINGTHHWFVYSAANKNNALVSPKTH